MVRRGRAVEGAVADDPWMQRGAEPQAREQLRPAGLKIFLLDDRREILLQLAQDKVVGIELALDALEQIVGVEVQEVGGAFVDLLRQCR